MNYQREKYFSIKANNKFSAENTGKLPDKPKNQQSLLINKMLRWFHPMGLNVPLI